MPLSPGLQEFAVTEPAPRRTPVLYLHGFASSPDSTKARFFRERLGRRGVTLAAPDFNEPDFTTLTMSRMLEQLAQTIDGVGVPVTLMGSSLGAALAVLGAARLGAAVERLVLLAPAVMFAKPGHSLLPLEHIAEWERRGALAFFHYAYNEERLLNVEFYRDSLQHDPFEVAFGQPTLIFQGLRDSVVDAGTVEAFARGRTNVTLSLQDDDHQLLASLPAMGDAVEDFLGLLK